MVLLPAVFVTRHSLAVEMILDSRSSFAMANMLIENTRQLARKSGPFFMVALG